MLLLHILATAQCPTVIRDVAVRCAPLGSVRNVVLLLDLFEDLHLHSLVQTIGRDEAFVVAADALLKLLQPKEFVKHIELGKELSSMTLDGLPVSAWPRPDVCDWLASLVEKTRQ